MTESADQLAVDVYPSLVTGRCQLGRSPQLSLGGLDAGITLHRVRGATRLSTGEVAVVNYGNREVLLLDEGGAARTTLGSEGRGPEEFQNPFRIWSTTEDSIWVGDFPPWRFVLLEPSGGWVRSVHLDPPYAGFPTSRAVLENGHFVLGGSTAGVPNGSRSRSALLRYGANGRLLDTIWSGLGPRSSRQESRGGPVSLPEIFGANLLVSAVEDRLATWPGRGTRVSIFEDGDFSRPVAVLTLQGLPRSIRHADLQRELQRLETMYAVDGINWDEVPIADSLPAISSLMVGKDGVVWVELFAGQTDGSSRWIGVDPTDWSTCELVVPEAMEIEEFGKDYVLAGRTGAFDVELVETWSLDQANRR